MKYKIIHVELENYETRLWRDIAISGNPTLMEVAVIIASSMQVEFDEDFIITDSGKTYMSKAAMADYKEKAIPLENSHLGDLDTSFSFIYDLMDQWVFNCDVHGEQINVTNMPFAFVKDGYGQGLFESDKDTFEAYMNGILKPEFSERTFMNKKYYRYDMPYNMDFTYLGDFEKTLNLENMRYSKQEVKQIIRYIEEHHEDIENIPDWVDDDFGDDDYDFDPFDLDLSDIENGEEPTEEQLNKMLQLTRSLIAYEIFEDEDINKEYRRLNQKYDMNEVFDMITEATLSVMLEADNPNNSDMHDERLKAIRNLK